MANKQDIAELLALISVAYPNFKMVKTEKVSTADAYLAFLGDLDAEILKAAVLQVCSEAGRQFAPSVGEIRGAVSEIIRQANQIPSALDGWDEVLHAPFPRTERIMRGGEWHEPEQYEWKNKIAENVAKKLGWPHRFPSGENDGTDRAHFFKMYENELNNAMKIEVQLPEVRAYIENKQIKQLAKGMEK